MFKAIKRVQQAFLPDPKLDLSYIFAQAKSESLLSDRLIWLEQLSRWICYRGAAGESSPVVRLRFVLQFLERSPELKRTTAELIRSVLEETTSVSLLASSGIPSEQGFLQEASRRLIHKILPESSEEKSLSALLPRLFLKKQDTEWMLELPEDVFNGLMAWISCGALEHLDTLKWRQDESLKEASTILAAEISGMGVRESIRLRAPSVVMSQSPFVRLPLLQHKFLRSSDLERGAIFEEYLHEIEAARQVLAWVRSHLEEFGVSVELVFQVGKIETSLNRLEMIVRVCVRKKKALAPGALEIRLISDLIRGAYKDQSVLVLFRKSMALLSRKISERSGETGEHYITRTRAEYFQMVREAAGGGVLTAGTAMMKFVIMGLGLPPFFEGMFSAVNYSGSFIIMQCFDFKLATKQPSMTAAALAGKLDPSSLKDHETQSQVKTEFPEMVARLTRSQFAAALGNVFAVIPTILIIDWIWKRATGSHYLTVDEAHHAVGSLNLFHTLTFFYAALTGVLLWLASIAAGWVENASVYYRIPETVAQSRILRRLFGLQKAQRLAKFYKSAISGTSASICLGFLLAFVPVFGKFFGIPLEVRHVTLSSGSAALGVVTLPWTDESVWMIASTALSILVIGLLNFGVSFSLALLVAIRAREVDHRQVRVLFRRVKLYWKASPLSFLWPKEVERS
ncbi:MAG: hypothetical protein H7222_12480 [Methylotenera sp.]|nr:hypothetical protein [Oligoflexia bacterium]